LLFFSTLTYKINAILDLKETANINLRKLQSVELVDLDSTFYNFDLSSDYVLILFDPNCEHCYDQAYSISDTIKGFYGRKLVWISSRNISEIKSFSDSTRLGSSNLCDFTKIDQNKLFGTFGSVVIPQVFIYRNGNLLAQFKGYTQPKIILKSLE
jgi:hypothetical protein